MVDYKPRYYTGKTDYTPKKDIGKMDPRIQLYESQHPIRPQDIGKKPRTYDTQPPKYIHHKSYDKVKTYNSYSEYVPPWSRGKTKYKRERKPEKTKPDSGSDEKPVWGRKRGKVTFASLPPMNGAKSPLPAIGSIKRTMELFNV